MKRLLKRLSIILILIVGFFSLISCSSSDNSESNGLKEFSGLILNDYSCVYDGLSHSIEVEGELPPGTTINYQNNNQINVGSYNVKATISCDGYKTTELFATLTINKIGIAGVSLSGKTITYDGEVHSLAISGTLPDGIIVTYTNNNQVNAGTYEVIASFKDTDGNSDKYNSLKANLTINKANYDMSGVTFNDETYVYDGKEHELLINGTLPEGLKVSYEKNKSTNAGKFNAVANFINSNDNYNDVPSMRATLTINNKSIEGVSLSGQTFTYDGKPHSLAISGTLPNGITVTYKNNGQVNAGTYEVIAMFSDANGNNFIPLKANLVINKANCDMSGITFNDETFVYDGKPHALAINGTLPEDINVTYKNNAQVNAGTYEVIASFVDIKGNYNDIMPLKATLIIDKARCDVKNVKFEDDIVFYDGKPHSLSFEGTLPENILMEITNNTYTDVGIYTVTINFTDKNGNYEYNPLKATLDIIDKEKNCINFDNPQYKFSLNNNKLTLTKYKGKDSEIVIPKYVVVDKEIYKIETIDSSAFEGCTSLISVEFPDSVTSLGYNAFSGCTSLTSVVIPDGVKIIQYGTFINCTSLTSVSLPNGIISIGNQAFMDCNLLANITIPESLLMLGSNAFQNCKSLTSVTIPNGVTTIESSAFKGCTSLANVTIPDSVAIIGDYAFEGCTSLINITIPNSVTRIESYAFEGCTSLMDITIPNSVTTIDSYAFRNCTSIKNLIISNGVKHIKYSAFYNCKSLTNVIIPNSVTTIGESVFSWCTSLTNVIIPDSITTIGSYAFVGCESLTNVTIPNSVTYIGNSAFEGCKSLTSIEIPNSVTYIGNYAFQNCPLLTIYCEVKSEPFEWDSSWNYENCPVVWDYKSTNSVAE